MAVPKLPARLLLLLVCVISAVVFASAYRSGSSVYGAPRRNRVPERHGIRKVHLGPRGHLSFQIEGFPSAFSFLPRGTQIPPSGPSKQHNSLSDSTATSGAVAP